ncbi:MAG TPA: serine hydrolase [Anaerolineaceae bacterium]|nr:serine hydrolase [Anaerolineaceae bacterium]
MKRRSNLSALRWVSLLLIFGAVLLTILQLIRFGRIRGNYPYGLTIGGIPVGGMDRQEAAQVLLQTYAAPIELHYGDAIIQAKPSSVGFELDLEPMLSAADLQRTNAPFWNAFWDYLWDRTTSSTDIPLLVNISEDRLRNYLTTEIATRYDRPASAALPLPGAVGFQSGEPGTEMDVDRAVIMIEDALKSINNRVVNLTLDKTTSPRPTFQNLQVMVEGIFKEEALKSGGFQGVAGVYILDLQSAEEISVAMNNGEQIEPGIAFTAASTMKIPILISVFNRIDEPVPDNIWALLQEMIIQSNNDATDAVAQAAIDRNLAPLQVSDDLETLGMLDTFWAGYFTPGSPLLNSYITPANSRADVLTDPDTYDQTTPEEMGILLSDIYECSQNNGGALLAAFPGKITQSECKKMVDLLISNHMGGLLQAGLPEGTLFAHKHGWVIDPVDGIMHNISNAGIVYSPAGNYVIVAYLYDSNQIVYDTANLLLANLSKAVYNYFNFSQTNP